MPTPPAVRDRRQVSGRRVLCRCSLVLPKLDPFSAFRARREGFMVLNVRGGSLYLAEPFTLDGARRAFPDDRPLLLRELRLYPEDGEPVDVGDFHVRFLKLVGEGERTGLVLRFARLDEAQIELLNGLRERCPEVSGNEGEAVPIDALRRLR